MRILQISSARALGGGERHLADLARGLASRGHEVCAAVRPSSPLRDKLAALPEANVFTLPLRNAFDLPSALALARFARDRRVDIVHAHMARDYTLAAFAALRAPRSRLFVTRHVLFPLGRAHALTLRRAARVVAVSEAVARSLRARRVVPEEKILVIHNGIDFARAERRARALDREELRESLAGGARYIVGTVGTLSRVKGQEDFVRAAALVARALGDEVKFVIVGEDASRAGETRARLEALIEELALRERVRMLGWQEDLARVLSALDVFVSASRTEAFGLAVVEAMACGAPVLATATEGAREVVEDNVTGKLVPVGDYEAMAESLAALLRDPAERRRLSERARETARARFDIARMVEETERAYLDALEHERD